MSGPYCDVPGCVTNADVAVVSAYGGDQRARSTYLCDEHGRTVRRNIAAAMHGPEAPELVAIISPADE